MCNFLTSGLLRCNLHIVYCSRKVDKHVQLGKHSQDLEEFQHHPQNTSCSSQTLPPHPHSPWQLLIFFFCPRVLSLYGFFFLTLITQMFLCLFLMWADFCLFRGRGKPCPSDQPLTKLLEGSPLLIYSEGGRMQGFRMGWGAGQGQAFAEALFLPAEFTIPVKGGRKVLRQPIFTTFPRIQHGFWTLIFLLIQTCILNYHESISIPDLQLEFNKDPSSVQLSFQKNIQLLDRGEALLSWMLGHFQQDLADVACSLKHFFSCLLSISSSLDIPLHEYNLPQHPMMQLLKLECHSPVTSLQCSSAGSQDYIWIPLPDK